MITKQDADNIINSWACLTGKELETMLSFYNALFKTAPELRFYFPDDMNTMAKKLQMTIDIVVGNVHDLEKLVPELHKLGRYHKNKVGVESSQYPQVVKSLLFAIKKAMGDEYTTDIGQSWKKVLIYVSRHMISAPPQERNIIVKFFKNVFSN